MKKRCPIYEHGRWSNHFTHCPYPGCGRLLKGEGEMPTAAEPHDPDHSERTEQEKIEEWRLEQLERAGFPKDLAIYLACDPQVDLYLALATWEGMKGKKYSRRKRVRLATEILL